MSFSESGGTSSKKRRKKVVIAMKGLALRAQKGEGPSIVHEKTVKILNRCKNRTPSGIIRFPEVYHTLSWMLHLNKREAKKFLKELENCGLIEIVPFNGIRIRARALREEVDK
jgi:hypothetical protein